MDRIRAELSDGPVTLAYDPDTGPSEHLLYFDSSSRTAMDQWHHGQGSEANGPSGAFVWVAYTGAAGDPKSPVFDTQSSSPLTASDGYPCGVRNRVQVLEWETQHGFFH